MTSESVPVLPSYIDREWLDHNHPISYHFEGVGKERRAVPSMERAKPFPFDDNGFNRCMTCEEWSPCRVRTLFEHDATLAAALAEKGNQ